MEAIKNVYILTDEEVARLTAPTPIPAPPSPPPVIAPVPSPVDIRVPGVTHEYSTFYPGNPDHRKFLFQYSHGAVGLFDSSGALHHLLPSRINTNSQPRWRRKKPTCLVYLTLNEIREFDVSTNSDTLIRKFDQPPYAFPSISTLGEADLSVDDDHIVLCSGNFVFVYQFSTDTIVTEFHVVWPVDNLMLTPDNDVLVTYYPEQTADGKYVQRGEYIYDRNEKQLRKLMAGAGHQDVGRDVNGDSIAIWFNSADGSGPNQTAAIPCPNGVVKVRVADGHQTCTIKLDWSLAGHVSIPDGQEDWYLLSTFAPKDPNSAVKYANELLMVAKDGSGVKSLGKHGCATPRTAPTADAPLGRLTYTGQPRASVSPDGTRMIYSANGDVVIKSVA